MSYKNASVSIYLRPKLLKINFGYNEKLSKYVNGTFMNRI